MLTCSQLPGGPPFPSARPATSTRPSAGDRTTASLAPVSARRSGSRKKKTQNDPSTMNRPASRRPPAAPDISARTKAPAMNGQPAGSRRIGPIDAILLGAYPSAVSIDAERRSERVRARPGACPRSRFASSSTARGRPIDLRLRLKAAAQNVFHPVFQLQLLFLQRDFLDLFRLREVVLGGQFVQSIFERVVPGGQGVEFLVRLQQQFLEVLCLPIHIFRLLEGGPEYEPFDASG